MATIIVVGIGMAMLSAMFLWLGLRGLIGKKPFILSQRWQAAFMLAGLFPMFFQSSQLLWPKYPGESSVFVLIWPVFFLLIAATLFWGLRGYLICNASHDEVRKVLLNALQHLELPFQESASQQEYRLSSLNADLECRPSSFGTLLAITMKQHRHHRILKQIADSMKSSLSAGKPHPDQTGNWSFLGIGAILFCFGCFVLYLLIFIEGKRRALLL